MQVARLVKTVMHSINSEPFGPDVQFNHLNQPKTRSTNYFVRRNFESGFVSVCNSNCPRSYTAAPETVPKVGRRGCVGPPSPPHRRKLMLVINSTGICVKFKCTCSIDFLIRPQFWPRRGQHLVVPRSLSMRAPRRLARVRFECYAISF